MSFISESSYQTGIAMEVKVLPKSSVTPPMTAFIEVVRSIPQSDGSFENAESIKSLK
jgi:hypothetical protein